MAYQPYLIANLATGIDKQLQPWLSPDDAQQQLYDGYTYRGTMSKREGYNYFAIGQVASIPYCESRIVNRITSEQARTSGGVLVTGNGTAGPYLLRIQNLPLRRGTVTITAGAQTALDNGLGAFVTTPPGGTGTVDYTTGDVSITFNAVVAGGQQLTATYDYHPGLPVMMIATFVTSTNTKELIVSDQKRLNRYNASTRRLDYIGRTEPITGITVANPGVVTAIGHGLTTGDKVFIYGVAGMNEVNNQEFTITVTGADTFSIGVSTSTYTAYTSGGTVQWIFSGDQFNFFSWVNYPDKAGNPRLLFTNNADEIGYYAPHLTPTVGEYIHYPTAASPEFFMFADDGTTPITTLLAAQLQVMKDRLLMFRTTENTVVKPKRIRISGTGQFCDDFRTTATGAGKIDVPDAAWLNGSSFNRDDLLFDTEDSSWTLKYTGNDTVPFAPQRIDESRGCGALFSMITYLNRTSAASPRGLVISDGYRVERQDENIPDFSYNEVDGKNFELCFAGSVDADRDHYLIYPQPKQDHSTRILTTNYEEDNYAIYRLPLSCMGTFITSYDVTWNDLFVYNNWAEFGAAYGDWQSFAYTSGAPFSLGGGHRGEIWRLNVTESEDNPVKVRNITKVGSSLLQVTTDWNNYSKNADDASLDSDVIFFTGIEGMVELNGKQFPIDEVIDNYTFNIDVVNNSLYSDWTATGTSQRVIPFVALFKKFNPFINADKKVRCGWLYMYVDSTGTNLTRNIAISGATKAATCVVTTAVNHNLQTGEQINIFGVAGMTQLNGNFYYVTVLSPNTISLGVDSTSYGTYTSGGYVVAKEKATMQIRIITDDNEEAVKPSDFKGTCTNLTFEAGFKKWYKVYINITAKFIQFQISNQQAGAKINVQALMPGFEPSGKLI